MVHQIDHFERRQGAVGAFISDGAPASIDGLVKRLAGQQAEQNGQLVFDCHRAQRLAHLLIDVLIVRRFASDDGPQADDGGKLTALGKPFGNDRQFPCSGHPGDRDRVGLHAML